MKNAEFNSHVQMINDQVFQIGANEKKALLKGFMQGRIEIVT